MQLYKDGARGGVYDAPIFGEGGQCPRLMLIGEAPGADEVRERRPFVGKAGKQLNALLEGAAITRAEAYVTNAVKFRPTAGENGRLRNRTPKKKEVTLSLPLLRLEIELIKPGIIATLGNIPLNAVLSIAGERPIKIGEAHGKLTELTIGKGKIKLFALYHPASVIYKRELLPVCAMDIEVLAQYLNSL